MSYSNSVYVKSIIDIKDSPNNKKLSEIAFWGRSNVGKSSLINLLTQKKSLSKISNRPGKTKTLNFFLINDIFYLVDMPGYGYAKVSITERKKWTIMIEKYILENIYLKCVMVLVDARLHPQNIDLEHMGFLIEQNIPFHIVFTKTDKTKSIHIKKLQEHYTIFFKQFLLKRKVFFFCTNIKQPKTVLSLLNHITNTI